MSLPVNHHGTVACRIGLIKTYSLFVFLRRIPMGIKEKMNEQQNRFRVTHVAKQGVSNQRSLSTAEYKVLHHIFLIFAPCVALEQFAVHLECSMSLYQIIEQMNV